MKYTKYCSLCGLCKGYEEEYQKICPRLTPPKEDIKGTLGKYKKVLFVKGTSNLGTYSGSIVSVMLAAKKLNLIDGVLGVERGKTIIQPKPKYASTEEEIIKLSGMRHTISSHLSLLNNIPKKHKIAIVGLPCHIEALNKIKNNRVLKHRIEYLIGIACGTNYEYTKFLSLINSYNLDVNRISYYTLRDTERLRPYFSFIMEDKREIKIPVSKTISSIATGCCYCNDYMGINSDLSFGVLGAPKGYSLVLIRNTKGEKLINNAIELNLLEAKEVPQNLYTKMIEGFYKTLPIELYLSIAFKTKNFIGSKLMAQYKVEYLNKYLRSEMNNI